MGCRDIDCAMRVGLVFLDLVLGISQRNERRQLSDRVGCHNHCDVGRVCLCILQAQKSVDHADPGCDHGMAKAHTYQDWQRRVNEIVLVRISSCLQTKSHSIEHFPCLAFKHLSHAMPRHPRHTFPLMRAKNGHATSVVHT